MCKTTTTFLGAAPTPMGLHTVVNPESRCSARTPWPQCGGQHFDTELIVVRRGAAWRTRPCATRKHRDAFAAGPRGGVARVLGGCTIGCTGGTLPDAMFEDENP